MNPQALRLKEEGNALFAKRNYAGAESCYSQALVIDPAMTSLYTNRAMCRFNMKEYNGVIADCDVCLSLDGENIKANYFKSKALAELGDTETANTHAQRAYDICRKTDDRKSLDMTHTWVLNCRSEWWRVRERRRKREAQDLEREVLELLAKDRDETLGSVPEGDELERKTIWEESEKKAAQLRSIFERARKDDDREREVPPWIVDDISFNVMVDPVITSSGRSYDRAAIQAAIHANAVDPVTREPLTKEELRPNIVLRQACDWFLENNGWAYDW
ncbi:unnamed protein product [Clonostachys rosea f. rosea IK726]|uniref:U-box domain-containing protein n=2 Tax=Bionectria ochroleuca TaxID=29856 RepID=A0A8H7K4A4_BIOOC|nr:unnamed protein product [Clonostachys rosea f. rosea IK726]